MLRIDVSQQLNQRQSQYLSQQIWQSLKVLCLNTCDLVTYMQEQQNENPLLELHEAQRDPYVRIGFRGECNGRGKASPASTGDHTYILPAAQSFQEYLRAQINVIAMTAQEIAAANCIIDSLDDDGYLRVSLDDIASVSNISAAALQEALHFVQALDPVGVGSRTVAEYLHIKVGSLGAGTDELHDLIQNHLTKLAARSYAKIAKEMGISERAVRQYGDFIRSLDPRPCSPCGKSEYIVPDIAVTEENGRLHATVLQEYIPRLSMNNVYRSYVNCGDLPAEDVKYIRGCVRTASEVLYALEMRHKTLELVANAVIGAQQAYFLGSGPLQPLTMADVARTLDLHNSTVSRAVSGKYILCKKGVLPFKSLFSTDLSGGAKTVSANAGKEELKKLLRENPTLSDQAASDILSRRGIPLARRTVSKYRSQLGIENTYMRQK